MKYNTSSEQINVLLIDDDQEDYLLTKKLFSRFKNQQLHLDWVSSYEKGLETVLRKEHQVCLVDYRLGERNGIELLGEAIRQGCQVPIIILTGQGDHDIDIEAMRAGAADYLVKHETNAMLLERTIRHAITLHERKLAAEEGNKFLDVSLDMLCIIGNDGYFKRINPAWERTLGYSAKELLAKPYLELVHPEDKQKTIAEASALVQGKETISFENRYLCKDGSYKWLSWRCSLLSEQPLIYAVARDVTQRKVYEESLKQSRDQIANIMGQLAEAQRIAQLGSWEMDVNSKKISWSDETYRIFGLHPQDFDSTFENFLERVHPKDREMVLLTAQSPFKDGSSFAFHHRIILPDESVKIVFERAEIFNDDEGNPTRMVGTIQDVTDRRQAEEALRESQELLSGILRSFPNGSINVFDKDFRYLLAEGKGLQKIGLSSEQVIGKTLSELYSKESVEYVTPFYNRTFKGEEVGFELTVSDRIFYIRTAPLRDKEENIYAILSVAQDITHEKHAEEQLQRNLNFTQALTNNIAQGVFAVDNEGLVTFMNPAAEKMIGWSQKELIGKDLHEMAHFQKPDGSHLPKEDCPLINVIKSGETVPEYKDSFTRRDGTRFPVLCSVAPMTTMGQITGAVQCFLDITQRELTDQALRESREHLELAQEVARIGSFEWNLKTGSAIGSISLEALYGIEKETFIGKYEEWKKLVHPEDLPLVEKKLQKALESGESVSEFRIIRPDGGIRWIYGTSRVFYDTLGAPERMVGVNMDITDQKAAEESLRQKEEQLRQAQKLESVGRLAGGIAHDFNNMLTAINGYSDLTLRKLDADNPLRRNIEEIKKAGERSASLTHQLLAFSRQQILQPVVLELDEIINDTAKLLQRLIGEDIELRITPNPDAGKVEADPGQITQVLLNLAINARDAMPRGGVLTIQTSNTNLDKGFITQKGLTKSGSYVMLTVSDTGEGMNKEIQERIFEPFFTTKEAGKGTGLGLATVYGIVKQSGGHIGVYSESGLGTTFKIYLPLVQEKLTESENGLGSETLHNGTGTILLVEDEEIVRNLTRQVLIECGYKLIEARNGIEALQVIKQSKVNIDLIITDVVMPEMDGRELTERLKVNYPHLKVLYMSGYTDDVVIRHGILKTRTQFLQKPFTFDSLSSKVKEVLNMSLVS